MISINVITSYFSGLFFNSIGRASKSALCYRKLTGASFDLPEKDRYSYRSLLSGIKRVYTLPIEKAIKNKDHANKKIIVYDLNSDAEKSRIEFLNYYGIKDDLVFIASDKIRHFNSGLDKVVFIIVTMPVQVQLMISGLFKKDKSGLSSILKNILLTRNLVRIATRGKASKVILFSIYDTNSSFLANSIMREGIYVSQVTSEVPLYKWNRVIVTNELILCSEYQEHELNEFKVTLLFDKYTLFGPELYYKVADLYKHTPLKNNKLGFYSTGGWLRKKLGHADQGVDIKFYEAKILKDLATVLRKRKDIELIIYPHPREWVNFSGSEVEMRKFYSGFLGDTNFNISAAGKPTNLIFDEVYLAVCYMTTVIFERMHAGRKSAFVYFKENGFPVKKGIKNLSIINNEVELEELVLSSY
jgi:hypothetical protein